MALLGLHRGPASHPTTHSDVPAASPQTIASEGLIIGQGSVIDGDTLDIHGIRIRLNGIDAPEAAQKCEAGRSTYRCGQKAAFALDEIIADKPVSCIKLSTDRYGRTIGKCTVAGVDVSGEMVKRGWAVAFRKYSLEYVPIEDAARASGVGLWAGTFQDPAQYRLSRKKS
ncbi:thermonuclease family protein [Mesorhizobium sp. M0046]|uniref:thermonuclease family protein n=1 Tax=Mesorhizobium sp. M0046 TaxID=2956858 RepID=UPI00333507E7